MTQITNDYIFEVCADQAFFQGEDILLFAGAATTQAAAYPIKSSVHRVTASIANAALGLKSIMSNDNPQIVVIINDSPNTIKVFPFLASGAGAVDTTENINGVATGFSIATVTTGVFFSSLVQIKRKGSGTTPALNWTAATFS